MSDADHGIMEGIVGNVVDDLGRVVKKEMHVVQGKDGSLKKHVMYNQRSMGINANTNMPLAVVATTSAVGNTTSTGGAVGNNNNNNSITTVHNIAGNRNTFSTTNQNDHSPKFAGGKRFASTERFSLSGEGRGPWAGKVGEADPSSVNSYLSNSNRGSAGRDHRDSETAVSNIYTNPLNVKIPNLSAVGNLNANLNTAPGRNPNPGTANPNTRFSTRKGRDQVPQLFYPEMQSQIGGGPTMLHIPARQFGGAMGGAAGVHPTGVQEVHSVQHGNIYESPDDYIHGQYEVN